jgi:uncharacterized protein YuzE
MLIKYDKTADAKYITLLPSKKKRGVVFRTEKVKPWLMVDYDRNGNIFGIEVLDASKNEMTLVMSDGIVKCFPAPKIVKSRNASKFAEDFFEPAGELSLSIKTGAKHESEI